MKLAVVLGSTRQNRQSIKEAKWVVKTAQQDTDIQAEMVDLNDYPMPFFDEPISPRYNPNRTVDPAVQKWLDKIEQFDAYVFVTPEYNHSIPAVLKNAFDYLTWELQRKPATIVSHGTVGGARAAMHLKEIISEGKAVPIPSAVAVAGMSDLIDDEGNLAEAASANPYGPQFALQNALEELKWYSDALAAARTASEASAQ
ncbi:MAG TPA: NADPH-dependent FMN reductase [Candidatus Saccharimonadales bacterium]|nr:NADPH-dependent FMN reductase [Candidatus Saccharimonadales bacterium]